MISRKILNVSSESSERMEQRLRQFQTGKIFFKQSAVPVDCIVHDATANGNRLTVMSSSKLPKKFTLLNMFDGVERQCKLVWRERNDVGVRFV